MLTPTRKQEKLMEYAIRATAPGSAISAFVYWQTDHGAVLWGILTAATACLTVAKPILNLTDRIATLVSIVTTYGVLDSQLKELQQDIARAGAYDVSMIARYKDIHREVAQTCKMEPVEEVDKEIQRTCFEDVKLELPESSFFLP